MSCDHATDIERLRREFDPLTGVLGRGHKVSWAEMMAVIPTLQADGYKPYRTPGRPVYEGETLLLGAQMIPIFDHDHPDRMAIPQLSPTNEYWSGWTKEENSCHYIVAFDYKINPPKSKPS